MTGTPRANPGTTADTSTPSGTEVEESSPEQLVRILRRYREAMHAALLADEYRPIPPAANWLLLALTRQPGTVGDLAERLSISKQTTSRLADQLVRLDYCDRQRSQTNRRQVQLSATEEGRGAAQVVQAAITDLDAHLLGSLDNHHQTTFRQTLTQLAALPVKRT